jgi:hypothetical protein
MSDGILKEYQKQDALMGQNMIAQGVALGIMEYWNNG